VSSLILPFFVIIPVLIAVFLFVFSSVKAARKIALIFQGAFVAFSFVLLLMSRQGEVILNVGNYQGILGIILRSDMLASVFVLLTAIIFFAVSIYSVNDNTSRLFWFLLFLLEGSLVGLFLTRDFFNIFVLVEVSTVVVTILLMYDRERRNLFAGMTFIMVNIVVMQFYLFGLGYIYMITGVLDIETASGILSTMEQRDLVLPYALIMTSIASKCSLLPLLTWLPKINSMPGSRSSIAAIMSGLHIKSGVYMFIRMQELFGGMASDFFLVIGIITAVAGVILALSQTDIRLILAYSTLAQVSLIIIGLNLYGEYSYVGSVFHIINHALFKVALFLGTGMIITRYRTTDITKMRGLLRDSPIIAIATAMAILGMIGAPLFNGSMSKYFLMQGAYGLTEWLIILINLGTVLIFVRYFAILFGSPLAPIRQLEPDWYKNGSLIGLGVVILLLGVLGPQTISFLLNTQVTVDIWGYMEKVLIFAVSIAIGLLLFKYLLKDNALLPKLKDLDISFKHICLSIGFFFGVLLVYVGMFN